MKQLFWELVVMAVLLGAWGVRGDTIAFSDGGLVGVDTAAVQTYAEEQIALYNSANPGGSLPLISGVVPQVFSSMKLVQSALEGWAYYLGAKSTDPIQSSFKYLDRGSQAFVMYTTIWVWSGSLGAGAVSDREVGGGSVGVPDGGATLGLMVLGLAGIAGRRGMGLRR